MSQTTSTTSDALEKRVRELENTCEDLRQDLDGMIGEVEEMTDYLTAFTDAANKAMAMKVKKRRR